MTVVSVVITTRNRRMLLSETIATVQEQTFGDWELIVVDDASTDDTPSFLATLRDSRIRVLRLTERRERCLARNAGLEEARGEFIMFLDDDDLLRADALSELVRALRSRPDALAAAGACRIMQRNGDSVRVYRPVREHTRVIWRELLFGWWSNSGQNLYRTATIREIGGFDPAFVNCQDRKHWLAVAWRGPVCVVPSIAMEYRQHDGQAKLPNVDELRQLVWREFITGLPISHQPEARRIRRAAELVERADNARVERRFTAAIRMQLHACWLAPSLLRSPLTRRPLWWGLKKCLLRTSAP